MLYNSTGNLPIYNFDKILRNNDYRYLIMEWNERDEVQPPKEAEVIWSEIYDKYCIKTETNQSLSYYALNNEVSYLECRFFMIVSLVEGMTKTNKEDFGRELNAWGVRFNTKGKIKDQIPLLTKQIKAAKQKYDLKKFKLNSMESRDGENISILKQKIRLERITGLTIDLRKCVVDEWIEINNEAVEVVESQKRNGKEHN